MPHNTIIRFLLQVGTRSWIDTKGRDQCRATSLAAETSSTEAPWSSILRPGTTLENDAERESPLTFDRTGRVRFPPLSPTPATSVVQEEKLPCHRRNRLRYGTTCPGDGLVRARPSHIVHDAGPAVPPLAVARPERRGWRFCQPDAGRQFLRRRPGVLGTPVSGRSWPRNAVAGPVELSAAPPTQATASTGIRCHSRCARRLRSCHTALRRRRTPGCPELSRRWDSGRTDKAQPRSRPPPTPLEA